MDKKLLKVALIAIISVLFIDQGLKIWVKTNMFLYESIDVFTWFKLYYIENPGMAFGMQLFGGEVTGKLILSIFRIIAIGAIGYYLWDLIKKKAHKWYIIAIALIFSGALGNILDSAFYDLIFDTEGLNRSTGFLLGSVVDMLYFPLIEGSFPSWFPDQPSVKPGWMPGMIYYNFPWANQYFEFFRPIFNIADAAITGGVIIIVFGQRKFFPKKK